MVGAGGWGWGMGGGGWGLGLGNGWWGLGVGAGERGGMGEGWGCVVMGGGGGGEGVIGFILSIWPSVCPSSKYEP